MKICFLGQINQEGNPDGRGTLYFDKEKVERFEGHFSDGNNSYFQNLYGHGCCVYGLTLKQPHGRGFNICIKLYWYYSKSFVKYEGGNEGAGEGGSNF